MSYKFHDDISIADVAFEADGNTLEEVFVSSAEALTNTMVKDLKKIEQKIEKKFKINADNVEKLLHNFLEELIYYKDAKLLLFIKYDIKISKESKGYVLTAKLKGEKLDMKKHELLVDVKAVSWHMFELKKERNGWVAFVILDI